MSNLGTPQADSQGLCLACPIWMAFTQIRHFLIRP